MADAVICCYRIDISVGLPITTSPSPSSLIIAALKSIGASILDVISLSLMVSRDYPI